MILKLFNNEFIHLLNLKSNPARIRLLYPRQSDWICFLQDCLIQSPVKLVANIRVDLIHLKAKMRQEWIIFIKNVSKIRWHNIFSAYLQYQISFYAIMLVKLAPHITIPPPISPQFTSTQTFDVWKRSNDQQNRNLRLVNC